MSIERIGIRIGTNPIRALGDVAIDSDYVARWWLPIIGPSATVLLTHIVRDAAHYRGVWRCCEPDELAASIGVARGTGLNARVIRSLDRLAYYGLGHWLIDPRAGREPLLTVFETVRLVPADMTRRWSDQMRHDHMVDLAQLARTNPATAIGQSSPTRNASDQ